MRHDPAEHDLNRKTNAEAAHKVLRFIAKSSAGALAPIGLSSLANELFDLVVADPAAKRRDRFLMDFAQRISALEAKGEVTLEDLLDNEEAATLLFRATQAAMRSSGDQKLAALRSAAIAGLVSEKALHTGPAQIVVGIIDRMTEQHVIILKWLRHEPRFYVLGQVMDPAGEDARRSYFFGQPVFTNKSELKDPVSLLTYMDWGIYVERADHLSYNLAHADLASMGLLKPLMKEEKYLVGREVHKRTTSDVAGYVMSELGIFVCDYISGEK